MEKLDNHTKWAELESVLKKYPYLSRSNLPGALDGKVYQSLLTNCSKFASNIGYPDRMLHPNFYHWYVGVKPFSESTIQRWVDLNLYACEEDEAFYESIKAVFNSKNLKNK